MTILDPHLPQLNNWYVGSGGYKGQAELTTNDGKSYEGDATLVWDDAGNLEATVYLDNAPLMAGHQIMESNSARMAITTSDGGYRADRMIAAEASLSVGENSERPKVRLVAMESEYEGATGGKARYWVAPLINFISKFNLHSPDTDRHALRLYPTPIIQPASSRDEAFIIAMKAHSKNRLINFRFRGDVGFIEPLPSYAERAKALEGHDADRLVTALMIGSIPSNEKTDIVGVTTWFPWDYLSALSIATGTSVGCPFIELRDKDGVLVKRLHISRKPAKYSSGHHVLDESVTTFKSGVLGIESATGVLMGCVLTAFASKPYLRSIAYSIVAAEAGGIIEDTADDLVRAFEGFTTAEGVATQDLLDGVLPGIQQLVIGELKKAATAIRTEASKARSSGDIDTSDRLLRIASRTITAAQKEAMFGLAVSALLKKYGLQDEAAVNAHLATLSPPTSWAQELSRIRGAVIHQGFIDLKNTGELLSVHSLLRHLSDAAVRLFLLSVAYPGIYLPLVAKYAGSPKALDWVQATTPAKDLRLT